DFELVRTSVDPGAFSVIRSEKLASRSTSNSFFIACVLRGCITLTQAARSITLKASDLAVLDSTQPYRIDVDGRLDVLWVRVPRHRIEGRIARSAQVLAQRIDGSRGAGHLTSTLVSAALREADQLSASEALRISNTVLDLLCLSLDVSPGPDNDRPRELLRRIQNYIDANLADPGLSCRSIAKHHGISTRYLNQIFRREGLTAARWLRMRRLELCRQCIEQSGDRDQPISSVAYAHGFNSVSSFNRAFKRHFGTTPGSLRQLGSAGGDAR
ncbi:MAG: helix-turn-helix domain-containing protein, partial [Halieaceae bacterium]|nr:helix-turn-helix domain-containing protein [Halieaceae bacterium]